MSRWLLASVLLLPPLFMAVLVAARANAGNRLVAVQLAGSLTALILVLMTYAFDQSSFIDIALGLTLMSVPGTYLYTVFMERWL